MTGTLTLNPAGVAVPINSIPTYADPPSSITSISNVTNGSISGADSANFLRGMFNSVQIAAANTKNWTGTTGLVGMQNTVNVLATARAIVTNATGLLSTVQCSSGTGTITNAYGIRSIATVSAGGAITNGVSALLYGLGSAANNTGMMIATGSAIPAAQAGNYAIYDSTGYPSYHAGTVSAAAPTAAGHLATKGYVDSHSPPMVVLTQAAYDALGTKDPNTVYVVT